MERGTEPGPRLVQELRAHRSGETEGGTGAHGERSRGNWRAQVEIQVLKQTERISGNDVHFPS